MPDALSSQSLNTDLRAFVRRGGCVVYCDGSGPEQVHGVGGWAALLFCPESPPLLASGSQPMADGVQMELMAAAEGLNALPEAQDVMVMTDCKGIIDRVNKGLLTKHIETNYYGTYWRALADAMARHQRVKFRWVRAHSTDPLNCYVDQCASRARHGAH